MALYVYDHDPAEDATNVNVDTNVVFTVYVAAGFVNTAIYWNIDGQEAWSLGAEQNDYSIIFTDVDAYNCICTSVPPSNFAYNTNINVNIGYG